MFCLPPGAPPETPIETKIVAHRDTRLMVIRLLGIELFVYWERTVSNEGMLTVFTSVHLASFISDRTLSHKTKFEIDWACYSDVDAQDRYIPFMKRHHKSLISPKWTVKRDESERFLKRTYKSGRYFELSYQMLADLKW